MRSSRRDGDQVDHDMDERERGQTHPRTMVRSCVPLTEAWPGLQCCPSTLGMVVSGRLINITVRIVLDVSGLVFARLLRGAAAGLQLASLEVFPQRVTQPRLPAAGVLLRSNRLVVHGMVRLRPLAIVADVIAVPGQH